MTTRAGHQSSGSFCYIYSHPFVISTATISCLLMHDQRQMAQVMFLVLVSEARKECHCLYTTQCPFSTCRINVFILQRNSMKFKLDIRGLDASLAESWVLLVPLAFLLHHLPYQLSFREILSHKFLCLSPDDILFAEKKIPSNCN